MSEFIQKLLRPNILTLLPYSSARHEFSGEASVYLDANENSLGGPVNPLFSRYPDPNQSRLKEKIARIKNVKAEQIFLGNGSDEAIDILFRMFCVPGSDRVITCPPTYGMYSVSASIHDIKQINVSLNADFQLDVPALLRSFSGKEKLLFLCSPNNPSGNSLNRADVLQILKEFEGIVVVDEAYVDFSKEPSWLSELNTHPNLVILQTFSKAWGLAGLRMGMAFASAELIAVMNRVKAPYNLSEVVQNLVYEALDKKDIMQEQVNLIIREREKLREAIAQIPMVKRVFPSDANFILVSMDNARAVYSRLLAEGIVVRDRSGVHLCDNCLRITIGTPEENRYLLEKLTQISQTETIQ